MKKWLRRIRGAVGTGLTWAVTWSGFGAVLGLVIGVVSGAPTVAGSLTLAVSWAQAGFVGGAVFSVVLALAEGRRRFEEMSLKRFAAFGASGGLLLSLPVLIALGFEPMSLVSASIAMLLGAGSAAGSLALARRADDRELLEAGADLADAGLNEQETHELLGT